MNLKDLAHGDLTAIMHDAFSGAQPVVVTNPEGVAVSFQAWSSDIHLSMDPGTSEVVTGRQCSVSVLTVDLITSNFSSIFGESDGTKKPWTVAAEDVNGRAGLFKVASIHPDRSAGVTVMFLEEYTP